MLAIAVIIPVISVLFLLIMWRGVSTEGLVILTLAIIFGSVFFAGKSIAGIGKKKSHKGYFKRKFSTLVKPVAGMGLALLILLFNPVSDWYYYIGAILCMGSVIWAFLDIIKQHNILTTRKLP